MQVISNVIIHSFIRSSALQLVGAEFSVERAFNIRCFRTE